ncbi:hypothetical protein SAMN02745121_00270 [Nannocystis exedens]|uniref:Uncharacterized protein n=2 Tax=Nannocystis exedens TaxID=54 RepID=A0A1I1SUA7_9BACT|nr:hypothetical protein [Nannocystis exedens]SFD49941.1 hypothetical protein SAMN02745121_00270 [Nannocystis exedens]
MAGLGGGFLVATIGTVAAFGHHVSLGRELVDGARAEHRDLTPAEMTSFYEAYGAAKSAQRISIALGISSAALLGAAIPLVVSGRRAMRLKPYADFTGAGLVVGGRF